MLVGAASHNPIFHWAQIEFTLKISLSVSGLCTYIILHGETQPEEQEGGTLFALEGHFNS